MKISINIIVGLIAFLCCNTVCGQDNNKIKQVTMQDIRKPYFQDELKQYLDIDVDETPLSYDYNSIFTPRLWEDFSLAYFWAMSSSGAYRYYYHWQFDSNDTIRLSEGSYATNEKVWKHKESSGTYRFDKKNGILYVKWEKGASVSAPGNNSSSDELVLKVNYYQCKGNQWQEVLLLYEYKNAKQTMSVKEIMTCETIPYQTFVREIVRHRL